MVSYRFRLALPRDRRQIRLLLRCFERAELRFGSPRTWSFTQRFDSSQRFESSQRFGRGWLPLAPQQGETAIQAAVRQLGLGLLLGLVLQGLGGWGGLLLVYGLLGGCTVAFACWLNLYLFADWQNYWVLEQSHCLIACARLTYGRNQTGSTHAGSTHAKDIHAVLADVVVSPSWRGQGVGAFLVNAIVDRATRAHSDPQTVSIYLACLPQLIPFYQKLGFRPVELGQLSFGLRQTLGLRTRPALRAMRLKISAGRTWD